MSNDKFKYNICFLGGDGRQLYAAVELADRSNGNIFVSGETFLDVTKRRRCESLVLEENPLRALRASRAAILPLPAAGVEKVIPFADVVQEMKRSSGVIFGGMLSPYMLDVLDEEGVKYADYYKDESFTVTNAYITAEGALALAADKLDIMLRDARCAILGFGRIGMALGRMLVSLGCRASVYARRGEVRTLAKEMGLGVMSAPYLAEHDVVFNTVPERIVTNDDLLALPSGRILIELASSPGGFDPDIARQCGHTVVDGRGLPGRYAPRSAGIAVAEAICSALKNLPL